MSLCPDNSPPIMQPADFLSALINAERPGSEQILAFYDSRVNGICTDSRLLFIPLDDHMCHRGDGLFESIAYHQRRIYALGAHLDRLAEGMLKLDLHISITLPEIAELCCATAKAGMKDKGNLRLFLSRGPGGFGISPQECPAPSLYIVAVAVNDPPKSIYSKGLSAFSSKIPPKQDYLARIKNTNYLPNVFMSEEARKRNMDIAISIDEENNLCEAAIANIAIIDNNNNLRSPAIKRILPGTTLLAALELAASKMTVVQGPINISEIASAKEMLLFTSSTLCVPITSFNGKTIGDGTPGPVASWLKDALMNEMLASGTPF